MKKFIATFLFLTLSACGQKPAQNADFVPSLPDVPLPKGFLADPGTGSFFDSAEGRIVEMYATGFEEPEDISDFYEDTLPQFGWKEIENSTYAKEGEIMTVIPSKQGYTTSVKYQLRPMSVGERLSSISL